MVGIYSRALISSVAWPRFARSIKAAMSNPVSSLRENDTKLSDLVGVDRSTNIWTESEPTKVHYHFFINRGTCNTSSPNPLCRSEFFST